jgi:beta-lactam-binding protein with PASTA domain
VVVGLTAVTGFAVGSGITTARDGWTEERSPSFASIPDVRGQPRESALRVLEDAGLRARSRRESSEAIENGAATRTNPPAGAEVDSNSGVTLYLSSGPALAPATVPDVKGRSRAAALAILSTAGFRPTGATEPSKSVGEGIAIRTDPPAGAKVDRGAGVKLFVSSGSGTSTVELPDLSGHPAAEALAVLRDTGLRPISAPERSEFVREGVVTRTVPAAGASVEEGSDVTVFVSSGRPPGECEDGADNDDDGEIDGADPQCKRSGGQSE